MTAIWTTAAWRSEVLDWVDAQGHRPRGEVTQPRLAPWSTALRIPTCEGVVWLKAGAPGCAFEAALVPCLAAYDAPHLLRPLAADADRGWLLLPDGGPTLRETHPTLIDWERALTGYAALQRAVEGKPLTGAEDLRPERLPALFDHLLDSVHVESLDELRALQPKVASWCDELATSGLVATLQHDDLHDANIFADGTIFDFGDACLATPFSTLLVTQRVAAQAFALSPGGPELVRLRDAYLEAWTDTFSRAELELLALFACRVGKVARARAWQRALTGVEAPEHAEAVAGWLEELLEEDVF
ncbi:MAG: phosphotransferase [Mycobacteriales bacterium]